jgi:hypothetical protein
MSWEIIHYTDEGVYKVIGATFRDAITTAWNQLGHEITSPQTYDDMPRRFLQAAVGITPDVNLPFRYKYVASKLRLASLNTDGLTAEMLRNMAYVLETEANVLSLTF